MKDTAVIPINQLNDLWFFMTSKCNLKCRHCYVESCPTNETMDELNIKDVKSILDQVKNNNIKNIYLTGGEPFMTKDILEIISLCDKTYNTTVLTNSLFINNQIIKQLANKNITIRISLESMDEKKNDSIRGKGVYNKVLEIIKKLDKNNIKTVIAISESKENLRIANEFIKKNSLNTKIKEIPLFNKGRYTVEFKKEKEKKIIDKVKITKGCITNSNKTFKDFMCHNTRNVGKIDGKIVITPCPIVFKDIILSHNIKDSMREVELTDSACYDYCFKQGGSCSN